jgi:hypothetical protein
MVMSGWFAQILRKTNSRLYLTSCESSKFQECIQLLQVKELGENPVPSPHVLPVHDIAFPLLSSGIAARSRQALFHPIADRLT